MLKKVTALSFEITLDNPSLAPMHWPAVTYRGISVFDVVYGDNQTIKAEFGHRLCREWQECYLGYIPAVDHFVIGFDTWPERGESRNNVFLFKMSHSTIYNVQPIKLPGRMVYYDRQLPILRAMYPSLIDLRLD